MPNFIPLHKAITLSLGEQDTSLVSFYTLGLIVLRLYKQQTYKNQPLNISKIQPERRDVADALSRLVDGGILEPYPAITSPQMYLVLGRTTLSPGEIVCSADPFCYLSHLSAMEHHGLTDRFSPLLNITRPATRAWGQFAQERAKRDYGGYYNDATKHGFSKPVRPKFDKRIGERTVIEFNSVHLGSFRIIKNNPLRVATLGRTYFDMLTHPDLCGGILHVLSIFDQYAASHLSNIVDEINQHGSPIDKVRAGYILNERCGLQHPSFNDWATFATRGGSRKLDPKAEYSSRYSQKWCLSINVEEPLDDNTY